jgi:trehalose-phosphatase
MLDSLLQVVSEVKDRIAAAESIGLFLDFDGTIVPIEADPAAPRLSAGMAETLKALSSLDFLATTIISGRALEDLYDRIRLPGLIYAGNHGLEISGRNLHFVEPRAAERQEQLAELCDELRIRLRPIAGVIVECKRLTASVHYRQAAEADRAVIEKTARAAVARAGDRFRLSQGRKVFEILPRTGWHKGAAVRWIIGQLGGEAILPVYLGDDTTDEDAFCVLPDAVTIQVGHARPTCARYTLPDPTTVHEFLLWMALQEPARLQKR